jgi:C4-dicarboxylate-specific signal transduction histidine kinase
MDATFAQNDAPRAGSTDMMSREEHLRIVQELQARSVELETILGSIPDSYARIDANGIFVDFRRPPGRDYAMPVSDLKGRRFRDTLPAEAAEAWAEAIRITTATGETTVFEFVLPTYKGPLNREARFTRCGDGQVLALIRSTTKEKQMQAQAQRVVTDRLAALGTLVAGVAHEINNPLMFLLAHLELIGETLPALLAEPDSPEAASIQASLEEVKKGALRVGAIARDMAMFASDSDETTDPVNIHAVIDSALKIATGKLEARARVVRDLREVPAVRGNELRLVQVLLNLFANAAHAIEPGCADKNEVRVSTHLDAQSRVVVTVRDTGCGIPPEIISRIFDPFFTTKPVGVGTGLGLSICHGIVKAMDGELTVESTVGRGTAFFVALHPWNAADGP